MNPWINLPTRAPYILSEDLALIENHKSFLGLRLDALPEPVIGGLKDCRVVFLALNPGFIEDDVTVNMKLNEFIEGNRKNLNDPMNADNYYFAGGCMKE